jgi:class 3 adenylate cyclase/tetratricopeptide (TPR) repeat protein
MDEEGHLDEAIRLLESKRGALGDDVIDAALAPLLARRRSLGAPAEQRKVATVLFADVSGFTAMAETLDPEDVAAAMNRIWARVDEVITGGGGRIDKHIGDAVMAVFGLPSAEPDDAIRAVRSALAIHAALAEAERELPEAARAARLKVRVGIHTGPVHAGLVASTGEYTAMGDTVNLASRLESAAPIGGVLISHETWRHLRGAFRVRSRDTLKVKGRRESVRAYEVLRDGGPGTARWRFEVEGVVPPLIGREDELEALLAAFDDCTDDGRARRILLSGAAGLGKSRLLAAFIDRLEASVTRPQVFAVHVRAESGRPMGLMRDLVAAVLGLEARDGEWASRDLVRAIDRHLPGEGEGVAADIAEVFAPRDTAELRAAAGSDAADRRRRSFDAVLAILRGLTRERPAVVVLDDLQLADAASLDLVDHLMASEAELPLLLACAARSDRGWEGRDWEAHPRHVTVDVAALSDEETADLAHALLHRVRGLPDDLQTRLVRTAAGSPYYLEELVRSLVDDGILVAGTGWHFDETRVESLRIPTTLASVIQARLDTLPELERRVIRTASIFRGNTSLSAIGEVAQLGGEDLDGAIDALVDAEILVPIAPDGSGAARAVAFRQDLMRSVVYDTLLKHERSDWHRRAARWLENAADGRGDSAANPIAEHWEAAGEIDRAVHHRLEAGRAALRLYALDEAADAFGRVLEMLEGRDTPSQACLEALESMARLRFWQAKTDIALDLVESACDEARRLGDDGGLARALSERAMLQVMDGDAGAALAAAEEAVRAAMASGVGALVARTRSDRGFALFKLGRLDEAEEAFREALPIAEAENETTERFRAQRALMGVASKTGRFDEALSHGKRALAVAESEGVSRWIGMVQNSLGEVHRTLGDFVGAEKHYRAALARYERLGIADSALLAKSNLGGALVGQARDEEAARILTDVVERAHARWFALPESLHFLALARLRLGEVDLAYGLAIRSVELARGMRSPEDLGPGLRTLGEIVARRVATGHGATAAEARACFAESAEVLEAAGLRPARARTLRIWAGHEAGWGDPEAAEALWSEARDIFEGLGFRLESARMRSGVGPSG